MAQIPFSAKWNSHALFETTGGYVYFPWATLVTGVHKN
jgi:hypothetical protein